MGLTRTICLTLVVDMIALGVGVGVGGVGVDPWLAYSGAITGRGAQSKLIYSQDAAFEMNQVKNAKL